jgi:two-component system, OmpR family, phosphate regulon response regulator PhoB
MRSRILAIDDDAIVRRLLVRLLTNQGYEVHTAADGEAGLIALEEEEIPAAVICDLCLPGISGIEVVRRIKEQERSRGIPVLMLTGEGAEETRGAALESGADLFLTKPFSSYEILEAIQRLLSDGSAEEPQAA